MDMEWKPITQAEIDAKNEKIRLEQERLENRLEIEAVKNKSAGTIGLLALVIVILAGILLGDGRW